MRSRLSRLIRFSSPAQYGPKKIADDSIIATGLTPHSDAITRGMKLGPSATELEKKRKKSLQHYYNLTPHDEAIFMLHTAAEIEHSLMVQYLFAAYSLQDSDAPESKKRVVMKWRRQILKIATEEMGHLISVQNILLLLGGPLNFEREDFPF